ncbi:MAG: hypothetical protein F2723_06505 [Actinobacteria bacterium]|uniref:Unannotated protein n=1 Tax=freshwater metagenome TaxID=449393 RepID=A0A6J7DC90_9ZZZZ|nr:hypothetical protein [Actinomycetota bacterium]MSY06975.1 hypothetical protein [Actinomycetota bacterium]
MNIDLSVGSLGNARPVAIVTAAVSRHLDQDIAPTLAALSDLGISTRVVEWDDPTVVWSDFALALVRSPWDYSTRLSEYLEWIDRVDSESTLVNEAAVLRWSSDKHYLLDLEREGVPIIPSTFLHSGDPVVLSSAGEFVVKPSVSAGSRDTQRYRSGESDKGILHAERLLAQGRDVLIQPYIASVDERGETALVCFDGVVSHAVRKGPILSHGSAMRTVDGLYAVEDISTRNPTSEEVHVAALVNAAIPSSGPPTYVRIDLVQGDGGEILVLEVEANEPSLFLDLAPGSAEKYAAAISRRLRE